MNQNESNWIMDFDPEGDQKCKGLITAITTGAL